MDIAGCDSPRAGTLKQMSCDLMCPCTHLLSNEYKRRHEWSKCLSQETFEVLGNLKDFGKSYDSFAIRVGLFWYLGTPSLVQLLQYYWLLKPTGKKKKRERKRHNWVWWSNKTWGLSLAIWWAHLLQDSWLLPVVPGQFGGVRDQELGLPPSCCGCRNLVPLALAALAGAASPRWWVSSCCRCQGHWCCRRLWRWWIINPVNGIRSAWFQSFQNRILWDVLF